MKVVACIVMSVALSASGAFAQTQGSDTSIEGNTTISGTASNITTTASGKGAVASTNIGSISDSKIKGNTNIQFQADGITTTAKDQGSKAQTDIASINGATINGNTDINVTAKTVTTQASGGGCANTAIGSIGKRAC